jgi:chromatin segregation and condensation protein Rec8/ScpA/Scc1 (kleisin family)
VQALQDWLDAFETRFGPVFRKIDRWGTIEQRRLPAIAGDGPGRALRCRAAVASTLVAGLELARDGALALEQDVAWSPIRIRQRQDRAAGRIGEAVLTESAPPA